MPKELATAVVFDETRSKVLLLLRDDFRLWTLPGGMIEAGEAPEAAAVRETLEETGYQVSIKQYVGLYRRPQFNDVRFVYRAYVTGGQALESGPETVRVGWFALNALPTRTTPHISQMIQDGLADPAQPIQRIQQFPAWNVVLIRLMIGLRDLRNRLTGRK